MLHTDGNQHPNITPEDGAETEAPESSTEPHEKLMKPGHDSDNKLSRPAQSNGAKFEPVNLEEAPQLESGLPPEIWTIVQSAPAKFTPEYFLDVSRNLLENPNLTASHLSRAELSYKSFADATFNPTARHPHELASIVKHMKTDHQPRLIVGGVAGYSLEWTVVRKLIPRNPKLDAPLLQTCHLFTSTERITIQDNTSGTTRQIAADRYLVVYLPHVSDPASIPFYHPKVRGLAILYTFQRDAPSRSAAPPGTLSVYYDLFPEKPLDNRLSRTALKMLEIIHKHSRGRMAGYQKRVHHDVVIAQKPFQDTYAYLKGKYAVGLIERWVEQTPAEKHVFEDLGIAAFLVELWTDMYGGKRSSDKVESAQDAAARNDEETRGQDAENQRRAKAQREFPGFADIGCGNGLLVWILNQEGWLGWGFDARRRKTWATFGDAYDEKLKEMLLVPEMLNSENSEKDNNAKQQQPQPHPPPTEPARTHNGIFPPGTFLIANHADELTVWTPCLAFVSASPFLAIPCCSHNFAGTRFRAPFHAKHSSSPPTTTTTGTKASKPTQPSAYAAFCSYVAHLTERIGYVPEKEHLRIPSTRNVALLGRAMKAAGPGDLGHGLGLQERMAVVRELVAAEMHIPETGIEQVRAQWLTRGSGLVKPGKGAGH
ncbi:hypothetical protein BDV95DRAFT_627923 [Massariosphaeria phaeospora]|uniref:tRNA (uracil-O(2)-)-methyltransferase n=1 Tax=Massariosphaeria phaeospora TaxID=100035 RepID=A0A7C8ID22_9PLEO|nr:hypothetical protein BDV95DRAFT_627923 [Massariosphaeria phaeospora]